MLHTVPCQHPLALPETLAIASLNCVSSIVLELSRATMPQLPLWTMEATKPLVHALSTVQICASPGPIPSCSTRQARHNYMYVDKKKKKNLGIQIQTCRPQYVIRGLCHASFICPSTKKTPPRELQRCPPSPHLLQYGWRFFAKKYPPSTTEREDHTYPSPWANGVDHSAFGYYTACVRS